MRSCLALLCLAAGSSSIFAEDQPGALPADAAAAPAQAPAQLPAQDASAHVATPANAPAGRAPAPGQKFLTVSGSIGAGYDSNILLQPSESPSSTGSSGLALTAGARATAAVVRTQRFKMSVSLDGDVSDYPDVTQANLIRVGGGLNDQLDVHGVIVGSATGFNAFWLDSKYAATAGSENLYAADTWGRNVSIISAGAQVLRYKGNSDSSGIEGEVAYRHWYMLEDRNVRRRAEFSLRLVRFVANAAIDSYTGLGGSLGGFYRLHGGTRPVAGTIDLSARVGLELRRYDRGSIGLERERQAITTYAVTGDVWMCENASVGAFVGYTIRNANISRDTYDRLQAGGRLSVIW